MLRLNPTHRFLLLLALVVAGLSAMGWLCRTSPELRFLPARAPAEWIVYPNPPDSLPQRVVDSSAVFRRRFRLEATPSQASLTFCAFRDAASVSVNGRAISPAAVPTRNWKQPVELNLTGALRSGDNQLAITVANNNAPPALWAVLRAGPSEVRTDAAWEVSWAGAAWRPARLARDPMPAGLGNPLAGGEQPLHSLRLVWPALALMAVFVAGVLAAMRRGLKFLPAATPALALGLFISMWVALFANNLRSLPQRAGFDANSHIAYIQFLLTNGHLPLAHQGWEMYQPPLYYVVSAALLAVLGLALDNAGVLVLSLLGLGIAIAHLVLLRKALRLVFPDDAKKQIAGLTLAAFLPANLCLSQFVTNEVLAAMLVTASLWLCLLLMREPAPTWKMFAGLGACLGAALLTKLTAVLAVPFVFGGLLAHAWKQPAGARRRWLLRVAAAAGLCVLVGGWHYARLWTYYGNPLVGNWDTALGFQWWEYDGFRTASYYLRFGAALNHPWFSGLVSLPDGIYSTLWGDGLWSGMRAMNYRMPWNYDLMAAGYLLALVPTLLLLAGAFSAAARFVRAPQAELVMLSGYAATALAALVWMSLKLPYYAEVKSFYLLSALLPLCVLVALGWEVFTRRSRVAAGVVGMAFGLWALASFWSFWIRAGSSSVEKMHGIDLWQQKRYAETIDCLSRAIDADHANLSARSLLAQFLAVLGRWDESLEVCTSTEKEFPQDGATHADRASALGAKKRWGEALAEARRAVELAPDYAPAHGLLAWLLQQANKPDEVVRACREALRVSPLNASFHERLGLALAAQARSNNTSAAELADEAREQLSLALFIDPADVDAPNNLAWLLATAPQESLRDGGRALELAASANQSTGGNNPNILRTLAAAYAEAGEFPNAVQTAQKALQLAEAQSNTALAGNLGREIKLYEAGHRFEDVR